MESGEITNPVQLFDWVREHARSEKDYEQFISSLDELLSRIETDDDESGFQMQVRSGTVLLSDSSQRVAYFVTLRVEATNDEQTLAILVDEATAKLGPTHIVGPNAVHLPDSYKQ